MRSIYFLVFIVSTLVGSTASARDLVLASCDDAACWRSTYRQQLSVMIAELHHWSQGESVLANNRGDQSSKATSFLAQMIDGNRYRHHLTTVVPYDPGPIGAVGWAAIERLWSCRTAIVHIKLMLVDISAGKTVGPLQKSDYVREKRSCQAGVKFNG